MKIELKHTGYSIKELVVTEGNVVITEDVSDANGDIHDYVIDDLLYLVNQMYLNNNKYDSDVDFVQWVADKYLDGVQRNRLVENLTEQYEG